MNNGDDTRNVLSTVPSKLWLSFSFLVLRLAVIETEFPEFGDLICAARPWHRETSENDHWTNEPVSQ